MLGVEVPLKWFFEGGTVTVAGLAAKIEVPPKREAGGRRGLSLAGGDSSPILFFVHPDKPSMVSLRHFVSRLGPDVRVEGLCSSALGVASTARRASRDWPARCWTRSSESSPTGRITSLATGPAACSHTRSPVG